MALATRMVSTISDQFSCRCTLLSKREKCYIPRFLDLPNSDQAFLNLLGPVGSGGGGLRNPSPHPTCNFKIANDDVDNNARNLRCSVVIVACATTVKCLIRFLCLTKDWFSLAKAMTWLWHLSYWNRRHLGYAILNFSKTFYYILISHKIEVRGL